MMELPQKNGSKQNTPLFVEIAGPAGAGKTTLIQALSQQDEDIRIGVGLELRKKVHLPIFFSHVPFLLPVFLRPCRSSRWFTWEEIKAIVYLRGWPQVLRQLPANNGKTVLLDHGPVFKLAKLNAFGPRRIKCQGLEKWWHSMFKQCTSTLDIVILLDAPDTILVDRIKTRSQQHAVKGKSDREAYDFLESYRTSFDQILERLTSYGGLMVLQFDTNRLSIDQIAAEVLIAIDLKHSESLN